MLKNFSLDLMRALSPFLMHLFYKDFWALRKRCIMSKKRRGFIHVLYWAYLDHIGSWIGLNTKMCDVPIFPHGLKSIFISDDAVIGARCVIFQQVTIGSNNLRERGAPVIEDDCYIGSGAKIIGRCTIGHNARVGANCVVVKDVPPNTTVVLSGVRYISHDTLLDNSRW